MAARVVQAGLANAITNGSLTDIQALINTNNLNGLQGALHSAVIENQSPIFLYLIRLSDPRLLQSYFDLASHRGSLPIVKEIVERFAPFVNVNQALSGTNNQAVIQYLTSKLNASHYDGIADTNADIQNAFFEASYQGDLPTLQRLIHILPMNSRTGVSPVQQALNIASMKGYLPVVMFLVGHSPYPLDIESAYRKASMKDQTDVMNYLAHASHMAP